MGVSLTFAGRRFLRRARQIIRNVKEGTNDAAAVGQADEGYIRISIYSSIASGFLAELLQNYGRLHANVRIYMTDGNPAEHAAAIRQLSLDVAFITGTRDWLDCERTPLWSERMFAVLPAHHPLAGGEELVWCDLADETFIVSETAPGQEVHDHLVRRLADLGRHPEIQV